MEQFISQNPGVVIGFITVLLALIGWLIKMAIADSQSKLKKHAEEIQTVYDRTTEIEKNYKQEFKAIRVEANDRHLEVLGILTEVRVEIAELKK